MIPANNSLSFVTDDGIGYNKCHFWSSECTYLIKPQPHALLTPVVLSTF